MKKITNILLLLCLALALCASVVYAQQTLTSKLISKETTIPSEQVQRLVNAVAAIHHYYIKPVTNKELFNNAISGMVSRLDPHSEFLDEKDLEELKTATTGNFDGIGVTIMPDRGTLKVISPLDNSPAQKSGIKAGDLIVRINDIIVADITYGQAIDLIRGPIGTKVTLYILRKNEHKPLKIVVTRGQINAPMTKEILLDKHYGYLRIAIFQQPTKKAVINAINKLQEQSGHKLWGLILDLRNNPGGLLNSSVDVANLFLDAAKLKYNKLIVYTEGYAGSDRKDYIATNGTIIPNNIPIVILINEGSASAAEIVAGALSDHKRALLLGTKSFGKGSVQSVIPISKNTALKLTTALYYTPKGHLIQAQGIEPDVEINTLQIPKNDKEGPFFDSVREENLQNHIKNGHKEKESAHEDGQLMYEDYQQYEALNLLKGLKALH